MSPPPLNKVTLISSSISTLFPELNLLSTTVVTVVSVGSGKPSLVMAATRPASRSGFDTQ